MKKNSTRIDVEIYLVFIVLIGVSVFNAIYSTVIISRNQDASTHIMTVDVPSLQMLENMNLLAIRSKMFATNWVYLPSAREDKEKLKTLHESDYPQLKGDLLATMTLWDNKNQQDTLVSVFRNFDELIIYEKEIMNSLVRFDDYEDPVKKFGSEEILETQILPRSAEIISALNKIIMSRKMQADASHNTMIQSSRNLMWSVLGIAIMIVIVVLLAGFYLSNSIIVPVMKLKNHIQQMGRGEIPEINIKVRENAVGQMTEAVKTLVGSVERTAQFANSIGAGDFEAEFQPLSRRDKLGNALLQMRESLISADQENKLRNWEATGIAEINQVLRENADGIEKLSSELLKTLAQYIQASCGGFYLFEENTAARQRKIRLIAGYALPAVHQTRLEIGEGFIGQAIRSEEIIHIKDIPQDNFKVGSGIGEFTATQLLVIPIMHQGIVYGAMEFSSFGKFLKHQVEFMSRIAEIIGSVMASSISNSLTKNLLQETQFQAEQLKLQEEKLRKTNEELSVQGELLRASKEELKSRNEDLKIKAELLQSQNERLEEATEALELKAGELEQSSKYKSEFLANMSHELRTPLNSVLILAKLLAENKNKTLTQKEIEYARVIYKSGADLLSLINDVLDLSKIEAGKVELILQSACIRHIKTNMLDLFSPIAGEKKIDLHSELHSDLPEEFITDQFRLEQVIKNLLSNALKFTSAEGTVTLRMKQADQRMEFNSKSLQDAENVIEFSVSDTGIGIPKEKQNDIFEAFQQADGSTSRKYGGTGLGLSISKMLVGLLGGEMKLKSEEGKGSTFYIYLPLVSDSEQHSDSKECIVDPGRLIASADVHASPASEEKIFSVPDDRDNLGDDGRLLLIVDDDSNFAKLLVDISHENKFKAIVTNQGDLAIKYAAQYNPSAILLDMQLPVLDGWTVLKRLKEDISLSKIPVHIMSALDKASLGIKFGALSYLRKPLDKRDIDKTFADIERSIKASVKKFLIISNNENETITLRNWLDKKAANCKYLLVDSVERTKSILTGQAFDCVIMNIDESWKNAEEIIRWSSINNRTIPFLLYHSVELTMEQKIFTGEFPWVKVCFDTEDTIHSALTNISCAAVDDAGQTGFSSVLRDKTVLITDDDMRNTYSLSAILEEQNMNVIIAGNGKEAIQKLVANPHIEIVLMDIMMPVMDGHEVLRQIRSEEKWKSLPIIALTANALEGTREECIRSGANEYISKPVNSQQLINLLEAWLTN
jgi:signal transduction histidine kinase/DNA-binding response OmpR family regulator/putative methionine-R-sulfoxide reductase with GAF domain